MFGDELPHRRDEPGWDLHHGLLGIEQHCFIFGDAPSFDWIVSRLETIEATVNRTLSHERTYARDLGMSF